MEWFDRERDLSEAGGQTMKNKGRSQYRFKQNPMEKAFARAWEKQNVNMLNGRLDGSGTLDYLLAEDPNRPMGEVTERDREVAATVVQWLGSPVGENFVIRVLKRKYLIEPKKEKKDA
jgi:hypothetical protein